MAPPRKRAQTKPADPEVVETPDELPEQVDAEEAEAETPPEPEPPANPKPAKSDVQKVETPCTECFSAGWADGVFAVGCEHGTWSRN